MTPPTAAGDGHGRAPAGPLRRAWCLGSEEFRQELLASMRERVGLHHYGMERHETGEQKAEQLMRSGLKQLHWTEADLETRPKGDKGKVKLGRVFKINSCRLLS